MKRLDLAAMSFEDLISREWLAVNHIGGYASATLPGLNSRKYHGLLVASMAPPVRRMVLLSRVEETVFHNGWPHGLGCNEYPGTIHPQGHQYLRAFSAEPFPRWAYQGDGWTLEKSLRLIHGENTVVISYTLLGGDRPIDLEVRPLLALRGIHELMYQWNAKLDPETKNPQQHRVPPTTRSPEVFFAHDGAFQPQTCWYLNTIYRREQERGYSGLEDLWNPGIVRWSVAPGQTVNFACSTEPIDLPSTIVRADRQVARPPQAVIVQAPDPVIDALTGAANQYVLSMPQDASTENRVAINSMYPWAAPAARSGLISFAGLFLVTGREREGRSFLQSLAAKVDQGLIPSEFPEDGSTPTYHSADASLWFAHALHQYHRYTNDDATTRSLLDVLIQIIEKYQHGANLGISADADGLLTSSADVPTSWMDARVGDTVITPRRGRTVELNALWHNALCVTSHLTTRLGQKKPSVDYAELAANVKQSFNTRFWNTSAGCCFDVIGADGKPDASIRPNQLLAISLPFPVVAGERQLQVFERVRTDLLTPMGVRTLAAADPAYHGRYAGNVVSRDKAHHQGSAFPWLLGPLVSALVRIHGRTQPIRQQAMAFIEPCVKHVQEHGQLGELFDGDAPHKPGGAVACAPSVAEILRCYVEDILDIAPHQLPAGEKLPQLNSSVTAR